MRVAQREARQKLLDSQKRRQLPESDEEEVDAEPPPEQEGSNDDTSARRLVTPLVRQCNGPFPLSVCVTSLNL